MAPIFTFADKDILQSLLLPDLDHVSTYFTIRTSSNILWRKITTLSPGSATTVDHSYPTGSIDWRNKTFTIGGIVKSTQSLKTSPNFFGR